MKYILIVILFPHGRLELPAFFVPLIFCSEALYRYVLRVAGKLHGKIY